MSAHLGARTALALAVAVAICTACSSGPDEVQYQGDYPGYGSVADITADADLIVKGKVVESRTEERSAIRSQESDPALNPQAGIPEEDLVPEEPLVVTVSTVRVSKVLKGEVETGKTVEVVQMGGTLNGVAYSEKSTTPLRSGKEYVFFLASQDDVQAGLPFTLLNPEQALYESTDDGKLRPANGRGNGLQLTDLNELERAVGAQR